MQGDLPLVDAHGFGIDLPTGEHGYTSVGGLVFDRLGREPRRGDSVSVNGCALTVESVERNRIALLRVRHDADYPAIGLALPLAVALFTAAAAGYLLPAAAGALL